MLRYYEALSDSEIAEVLGRTPGTVRGYASRALATLRVDLSSTPSETVGSGQTGCGYGNRDTLPGTWSRFTATVPIGSDISPGAIFGPANLARDIASGAWRVVGRTQLDGQQAIELSETDRGDNNTALEPLPVRLWVNAQTYLPIRLVFGARKGAPATAVQEFRYLPPTPANLALLRVPIPAGYPRR